MDTYSEIDKIYLERFEDALCACGKIADGIALPCEKPVCKGCVDNKCPRCGQKVTDKNSLCALHRGPICPHSHNGAYHFVEGYRPKYGNGGTLLAATLKHAEHMDEVIDHFVVLTRDM
ncbi:hypothetical protein EV714DRAFT_277825 [Schizophyllum commune]